ncbi:hypothetical protein PR202_ga22163 [Eleusine coracana subsp. coracana]|uniref:Uncharacterized protein n=1 Tax=Eleusine coracana subsp. coracana TaxID=191504 RepID=A0AAV5D3J9_ELECO|nr:hypothetical protein PR202_ga22163 [Eleusine coracana subsp. coracana]
MPAVKHWTSMHNPMSGHILRNTAACCSPLGAEEALGEEAGVEEVAAFLRFQVVVEEVASTAPSDSAQVTMEVEVLLEAVVRFLLKAVAPHNRPLRFLPAAMAPHNRPLEEVEECGVMTP